MKKIFVTIAAVFAVLGSAIALSACADGGHTEHDFTGDWVKTDPEYHWHVCAADGCDETDEKVAHSWVADTDKTDVAATCMADGIRYLKCPECGAEKSETITTRPNHDFTGAWVTSDPDYHWHVCGTEDCGEIDEKVAHDWVADESKTDVAATCIADGIRYLKCSGCGKEKSEILTDRPAHDFTGAWVNTNAEYHWHVCTTEGCDETDTKVAHVCDNYAKVDDDVHSKTCVCGYSVNEAHDWDEGEITTPPTDTEKGVRTYTCSVCHGTKTEEIPENLHEHTPNAGWASDDNSHWHTCSGCSEKLDKADHVWVSDTDKTDVDATCNSDGIRYLKCSGCGKEKSETLTERPAHDYEGQDYISDGADGHHQVCKACGEASETVAHTRVEDVTAEATFWAVGSKEVTCVHCDYSATETIARLDTASFADDFSKENNPNGSWSYGMVEYIWGANENFNFTAATEKTADGWKTTFTEEHEGGTSTTFTNEIKNGFIDSGHWATVAFTFTEETTATVNFKFTGNYVKDPVTDEDIIEDPNKFNCRIGVKNASNVIYGNPEFIGGDGGLHVCELTTPVDGGEPVIGRTYHFNAGDTIYFMIEHTNGWASGNLDLTITRTEANA